MDDHERRVAAYVEARESVAPHLRKQADAEIERARWLRKRRGVPSHLLYDPATGDALDPELVKLTAAVRKAEADVAWCQAVEIACAEELKGEPFDVAAARNAVHRTDIADARSRALALTAGEEA